MFYESVSSDLVFAAEKLLRSCADNATRVVLSSYDDPAARMAELRLRIVTCKQALDAASGMLDAAEQMRATLADAQRGSPPVAKPTGDAPVVEDERDVG